MWVRALMLGLASYLVAGHLPAQNDSFRLIQPSVDSSEALLHSRKGEARLEIGGRSTRTLPVRSSETVSSLTRAGTKWLAAGTRDRVQRRDLILFSIDGATSRRLSPPSGQREPFRIRPVPLASHSSLQGLVWLEGADMKSLSVMLAKRTGGSWSDPQRVPRPTSGSQTGLVATVLPDGRWLLVWSGFDGNDDELFFSLVGSDGASRPQRVTQSNSVPDVMPSLVQSRQGALLAWSQLDGGDYRVRISRFDGASWSAPRTVGPKGSQRPELTSDRGQVRLTYREAWPRRWSVAEIGDDGRPTRRARVEAATQIRPAVETSSTDTLVLRWSDSPSREAQWEVVR